MRSTARLDRRLLGWMARRLYAPRIASAPPGAPEKLLLVRADERVGNLITLQSMIDAVSQAWPTTRVGLLASARMAPLAEALDGLTWRHLLDKRWFFRQPGRWHEVVRQLRAVGYPVAIDCSAWHEFSFTHAALTYFSGAPIRLGFRRGEAERFYSLGVEPGPASEYELRQRMRLLAPLGASSPPPALRTRLGESGVPRWRAWLDSHRVPNPRVGLWIGSRKLQRRWPLPFYVQLARRLRDELGAGLVGLWGPGEEGLRDALAAAVPQGLVAAPATDLSALAGLLRSLDLVVTNDTGPMHLAVAVGARTLVLFASGDPARWGHPLPVVVNLATPGVEPSEIGLAFEAARALLGSGAALTAGAPGE